MPRHKLAGSMCVVRVVIYMGEGAGIYAVISECTMATDQERLIAIIPL